MASPLSGVSPTLQLHLEPHWHLRSITLNPILGARDGTSRSAGRVIKEMAPLLLGKRNPPSTQPIIWIEFQIGTLLRKNRRAVPELLLTYSTPRHPIPNHRSILGAELSRSVDLVATVALDATQEALEAAYGIGARACTSAASPPDAERLLCIDRPLYRSTKAPGNWRCYFAAPVCKHFVEAGGKAQMRLRLLPIDLDTRTPLVREWKVGSRETVAVWVPIIYPSGATDLTCDERRYVNLRVGWPRAKTISPEALSFPRVSRRFRVTQSSPAYAPSPRLAEDPVPWDAGGDGAFALDADQLRVTRYSTTESAALSLTYEDADESETRRMASHLISILAGVVAGGFGSLAVEGTNPSVTSKIAGAIAALVVAFLSVVLLVSWRRALRTP